MQKVKPLKKFGQNYLTDNNILDKLINEISPKKDDNLVEIGPGTGTLTEKLSKKIPSFTAVEIDTRVIDQLKNSFPSIQIIQNDFLEINLNQLFKFNNKKLRIVGNIPYNLTSPIIFKMIEDNQIIEDSVLMVQYEVAKRITAIKGTKDYGILSIVLKYFADVKFCFKVSHNVFYPKPKVDSAVIHIYFSKDRRDKIANEYLIKIVKASFGNRRKTLKNSLSNSIFKNINFTDAEIDLSLRAEQLDVEHFISLAKYAQMHFIQNGSVKK
ncbi:MAG: 16S rRNA (adenine(1518)-N(6)/adenine(1519)-N(6))-dimethyltransferase RsmA [Ignavibacteriaceae bacterium]